MEKYRFVIEALLEITSNSILVYQAYLRKEPKMKKIQILKQLLLVLLAIAVLGFAGCKKKGSMEKAGKSIDKAAKDTKDAVTDK
jgi:hypothetical protein